MKPEHEGEAVAGSNRENAMATGGGFTARRPDIGTGWKSRLSDRISTLTPPLILIRDSRFAIPAFT
jgi:hypothetical protein